MGKLVTHATDWEPFVLTMDHPDASDEPVAPHIHRVPHLQALRRASVAALNVATVREGLAWRPHVVIAGHIATSPGVHLLGRLLGVPTLQYVYANELTERPRIARAAIRGAAATVVLSQHALQIAQRSGVDTHRLHVIPPGVDAPAVPSPQKKSERPTILTVARLADRYKGFDVMLRAMPLVSSRVPDARWVVVGDGPLRGELERTARAWGLERSVSLQGQLTDAELDRWFARSHVFAMPARLTANGGGEGYGLVYLEAGSHGLPCVAGHLGAVAEAVVDGQTGLLVDATDHAQTAGALIRLLEDREEAQTMGTAARDRAMTLSWNHMSAAVEALVRTLVVRGS